MRSISLRTVICFARPHDLWVPDTTQVTGLTDHQDYRLRGLEEQQAALHRSVSRLDTAVAGMTEEHQALRQQCVNLEHGIQSISGAQSTMAHDLRAFMVQMGPILSQVQQQAVATAPGPAAPAPVTAPAAPPTPTADAPPALAAPTAGDGTPGPDAPPSFAPMRQTAGAPPAPHSGPYSAY